MSEKPSIDDTVKLLEQLKKELESVSASMEKCAKPHDVAKLLSMAVADSAKNMAELLIANVEHGPNSAVSPVRLTTVSVYLMGVNTTARSILANLEEMVSGETAGCNCSNPSCPSTCQGNPDEPLGPDNVVGVCLKCDQPVRESELDDTGFPVMHNGCGGEVAVKVNFPDVSIGTVVDKTKATEGPSATSNMPPSEVKVRP